MRSEAGRVLGVLLGLVTVVAAVEGLLLVRMEGRVSSLEEKGGVGAPGEIGANALGKELAELQERSELGEKDRRAVREEVAEAVRRIEALESAAALAPVRAARDGPAADPDRIRTAIEEAVARKVEEKMKDLPSGGGKEWKPSLQELAERLDLSERQTNDAKRIFDDAKHEVFELASLRREDGTTVLDDMAEAIRDPDDPEAAMKRVFASLFTQRIPGREETYIAEVLRIQMKTRKALGAVLDETQAKRLDRSNLDYLGVQTGYDPFAEYLMAGVRHDSK